MFSSSESEDYIVNYFDNLWLSADLNEKCFVGRHLAYFVFLVLPQLILYVFGLPFISLYFLKRNVKKLYQNDEIVLFRYGLLYAGYRHDRYYWEGTHCYFTVFGFTHCYFTVFGRTDLQSGQHTIKEYTDNLIVYILYRC